MSEHRDALDKILIICNGSRTYTRRVQQVHEVAMRALGLTAGQREGRHTAIFQRIGDEAGKQAYLTREAKRETKRLKKEAAAQCTESPP